MENEQSKDRRIVSLEHEVEILREQLESLKQELLEERQRAEDYREELTYTQLELEELDRELLNFISLETLEAAHAIKTDPSLKEQELSSSSLDLPFKLYSPDGERTDKDMRQELMMQLKSERSRLKKQFKELSQNFVTFKTYSGELVQQINTRKAENNAKSE